MTQQSKGRTPCHWCNGKGVRYMSIQVGGIECGRCHGKKFDELICDAALSKTGEAPTTMNHSQ